MSKLEHVTLKPVIVRIVYRSHIKTDNEIYLHDIMLLGNKTTTPEQAYELWLTMTRKTNFVQVGDERFINKKNVFEFFRIEHETQET